MTGETHSFSPLRILLLGTAAAVVAHLFTAIVGYPAIDRFFTSITNLDLWPDGSGTEAPQEKGTETPREKPSQTDRPGSEGDYEPATGPKR